MKNHENLEQTQEDVDQVETHKLIKGFVLFLDEIEREGYTKAGEALDAIDNKLQKYLAGDADYSKVLPWIEAMADIGRPFAQRLLARMYENGWSVPQDAKKAEWLYIEAANKGDVHAMFDLGALYENGGNNVSQDLRKAEHYYRKAAEYGYTPAQHKLALMYENGYAVKRDIDEAVEWYLNIAKKGDPNIQYKVAMMYAEGWEGQDRDYSKTLYWLRQAAQGGHEEARNALDRLEQTIEQELDGVKMPSKKASLGM